MKHRLAGSKYLFTVALGLFLCVCGVSAQTTWTKRSSGTNEYLTDVAFGAGIYVMVGEAGVILTSPDGVTWTAQNSGTTQAFRSVIFAGGKFVAVGSQGTILTSTDGVTWTPQTSGVTVFLSGIVHAEGLFVAVGGGGTILHSSDAVTWTAANSLTSEFLQSIYHGNGTFVTMGARGKIRMSDDGITWSAVTAPVTDFFISGAFFDGKHYVCGQNGFILSSSDFSGWDFELSGTAVWLRDLATDGQTLVAVGDEGTIIKSTDGTNWSPATSGVTADLDAVEFTNGQFTAAGAVSGIEAVILTSPSDAPPPSSLYDSWKADVFDEAEQNDPLISGPYADPDLDGLANVAEFLHDFDPEKLDAAGILTFAGSTVSWTHHRDRAEEVELVVAVTDSLLGGSWSPLEISPQLESSDGDFDTIGVTDPDTADFSQRYYRLEYSLIE